MTPAEIRALAAPLSEEAPCGPDLEMEGDADYMRFIARIEGVLPKSFATFDRGSIDFPGEFATLKALLNRSRDLRLLTFLAKLEILNRDLASFAAAIKAIADLLEGQWEPVHPQLLDGDAILRVVCLQMLDDMPDAIMPLQSAPLFETRRFGKATYRSHLLGSGQIQGRAAANEDEKDEETPTADAVKTALAEADIAQMVASRGLMVALHEAITTIENTVNGKTGQTNALTLPKIKSLAEEIVRFLDQAVVARDPAQGLAPGSVGADADAGGDDGPGPMIGGAVASTAEAQAALAVAARYFLNAEPSSPVLLLIGQAEQLIGKPFYDVLQALLPEQSAQANIQIGKELRFQLPVERLSTLIPTAAAEEEIMDEEPAQDEAAEETYDEPADEPVESSDEEAATDESGEASEDTDSAPDEEPAAGSDESEDEPESEPEPDPEPAVSAQPHKPKVYRALNRQDAVALLGQIAAYFRIAEPSSPVPLLLEHASTLAGRDFFGLLRDVLPAAALRVDE